jgi:hypothetical protein
MRRLTRAGFVALVLLVGGLAPPEAEGAPSRVNHDCVMTGEREETDGFISEVGYDATGACGAINFVPVATASLTGGASCDPRSTPHACSDTFLERNLRITVTSVTPVTGAVRTARHLWVRGAIAPLPNVALYNVYELEADGTRGDHRGYATVVWEPTPSRQTCSEGAAVCHDYYRAVFVVSAGWP